MQLTYFKRYRMEIGLIDRDFTPERVPPGYEFVCWDDSLLEEFARAKYHSFREELDVNVFPCLGHLDGCRRLMREISGKAGFLPQATWLAIYRAGPSRPVEYCGTIQGIRAHQGMGAIQNVGIVPEHRDCGLGTNLLYRSLDGFRRSGLERVYLEVTAQNSGAIRLYRRLGFNTVKTVFKTVEAATA